MTGKDNTVTFDELEEFIIHENDNYKVTIGESVMSKADDHQGPLYKIVNKTYGIVELETSWLPKALFDADDWDAMLKRHAQTPLPAEGAGDAGMSKLN
jgi:hypothetical protein